MLTDMQLLVLATRSAAVQRVVAASRRSDLVTVLANSPHLHPTLADTLATHRDLAVSQAALLRCQDPDVLVRGARRGVLRARWALRNPNMPETALTADLYGDHDPVLLARCINPSTPVEHRRSLLTAAVAGRLVDVGGSLAEGVVRGFELALANPWMIDTPGVWHQNIRRGLAGSPDLTAEQYAAVTRGRTPWPAKRSHPAVTGVDLEQTPVSALVPLANPAVDLHLVGRADLTEAFATQMVVKRGVHITEAHIIGRLIARFGAGMLCAITDPGNACYASGARLWAACYTHPAARYGRQVHRDDWSATLAAAEMLGDDLDAWSVAVDLSASWRIGPVKLADTATRLARAA